MEIYTGIGTYKKYSDGDLYRVDAMNRSGRIAAMDRGCTVVLTKAHGTTEVEVDGTVWSVQGDSSLEPGLLSYLSVTQKTDIGTFDNKTVRRFLSDPFSLRNQSLSDVEPDALSTTAASLDTFSRIVQSQQQRIATPDLGRVGLQPFLKTLSIKTPWGERTCTITDTVFVNGNDEHCVYIELSNYTTAHLARNYYNNSITRYQFGDGSTFAQLLGEYRSIDGKVIVMERVFSDIDDDGNINYSQNYVKEIILKG